jgi:hypothetical protein
MRIPDADWAVEAQDVATRDKKPPLLGKERHLISGKGVGHHLPQVWISPHMGQKPQQLTLGHGSSPIPAAYGCRQGKFHRLLTQYPPDEYQPSGHPLPLF